MNPIITRETITAPNGTLVKLRIVVYAPASTPINDVHYLMLKSQRADNATWYGIAETNAQLPDSPFPLGGTMQVFGGTTIVRHTTEADYAAMVAELRTSIMEHIAVEHPANSETSEADQTAWDLMNAGYEAAENEQYDRDMDRYERELEQKEIAALAHPEGLGQMDLDDYRARVGLTPVKGDDDDLPFDGPIEDDDYPSESATQPVAKNTNDLSEAFSIGTNVMWQEQPAIVQDLYYARCGIRLSNGVKLTVAYQDLTIVPDPRDARITELEAQVKTLQAQSERRESLLRKHYEFLHCMKGHSFKDRGDIRYVGDCIDELEA